MNNAMVVACLVSSVTFAPPAWADQQTMGAVPHSETQDTSSLTDNAPPTPAAPQPAGPPPLSGLFPEFGATLQQNGIDIHGVVLNSFLANPSFGLNTGQTELTSGLLPTVDLDLDKIANLKNTTIHATGLIYLARRNNPNMVLDLGSSLAGFQTTPAPTRGLLSQFTIQHNFSNGKFEVELGRTNPNRYFNLPMGVNLLTSFSIVQNADGGILPFVNPSWGGRTLYHIDDNSFVQVGIFEDNPANALSDGFDFSTRKATGAILMAEYGYRSSFQNSRLPTTLELGMYLNTSPGGTFVKGTAVPYSLGLPIYGKGAGLFAMGKQVVWSNGDYSAFVPLNLAVYGSVFTPTKRPQAFDVDVTAGVILGGLRRSSPVDAIGFQVHYARLSRTEADFETGLGRLLGGAENQPRNGWSLELNGSYGVTRWLTLTPTAQYYINADSYYYPVTSRRPKDGFIIGGLATISLGTLLGTSYKPF